MAMKDWEKDAYGTYVNKKNGDTIDIEYGDIGRGKKYFVFKNEKRLSPEKGLTKSQAFSYARSYMKSH